MSKNAVDSANGKAVSRRMVLTGAAASLPAVPAFALPSLAAIDDPLDDLLACAEASGVSLDLLHAATCTLDRDARRSVLASITVFAKRHDIEVLRRDRDDADELSRAFDDVGKIMQRIVAKHPHADSWSVDVADTDATKSGFCGSLVLAISDRRQIGDRYEIRDKYIERRRYRDGEFLVDPRFTMENAR